jgi:hypothetical protein
VKYLEELRLLSWRLEDVDARSRGGLDEKLWPFLITTGEFLLVLAALRHFAQTCQDTAEDEGLRDYHREAAGKLDDRAHRAIHTLHERMGTVGGPTIKATIVKFMNEVILKTCEQMVREDEDAMSLEEKP